MKILVTGATGFLGKYVIEELLDHDYSIVAFGRNEKNGKALEGERVQFIKGDLSSIEELRQAFQSVDAVVHAGAYQLPGTLEGLLSGECSWYSKMSLTCAVNMR